GAGKTTVATALAEQHDGVRYSPDDWMDAIGINLWDEAKRAGIEQLQWQQAQSLLALGGTAIIEWGTWARAERDTLREGARALGAAVELVHMDAPIDVLLDRVTRRGRESPPIDRAMLEDASRAFERPTAEELALYDSPVKARPRD
ncbi:MAG: ATP-binding protein, partial [Devosia sp.]|nr:ATP-binding protein [Devosia sp.]